MIDHFPGRLEHILGRVPRHRYFSWGISLDNCCALQFFHSDPVLKLRVRSEPVGSLGNDSSEDLCLIYPKAIARIDASDLKVGPFSPLSSHMVMVAVFFTKRMASVADDSIFSKTLSLSVAIITQ
jgi:hypothetical protein